MHHASVTDDLVTQYLRSLGIAPQPAYFGNSHFIIGWRIEMPAFQLVYRLEAEQLTICEFAAGCQRPQHGQAVMQFIQLIHRIEKACPRLETVRGKLLASPFPETISQRERLSKALIAQGARWEVTEGDSWLVYQTKRCHQHQRARFTQPGE